MRERDKQTEKRKILLRTKREAGRQTNRDRNRQDRGKQLDRDRTSLQCDKDDERQGGAREGQRWGLKVCFHNLLNGGDSLLALTVTDYWTEISEAERARYRVQRGGVAFCE